MQSKEKIAAARERWGRIAKAVQDGMTRAEAARQFGVALSTVERACRVEYRGKHCNQCGRAKGYHSPKCKRYRSASETRRHKQEMERRRKQRAKRAAEWVSLERARRRMQRAKDEAASAAQRQRRKHSTIY